MLDTNGMTKEKYKDCSLEEIKSIYSKLVNDKLSYANKEEQMSHDIMHSNSARFVLTLNVTNGTLCMFDPIDTVAASELSELIKEKTGEAYYIKFNTFFYSIDELIKFVLGEVNDPFWSNALTNFFDKLDDEKYLNPSVEQYEQELKVLYKGKLSDEEIALLVKKYRQLYKLEFLLALANDENKELFNNFCKELALNYDAEEVFKRYSDSFHRYK